MSDGNPLYVLAQANIVGVVQPTPDPFTFIYCDDGRIISFNQTAEHICGKMAEGRSLIGGKPERQIENPDYILPSLATYCASTEYQKIPYRAVINFKGYQEFANLPGPVLSICNDRREPERMRTLGQRLTPTFLQTKFYKRDEEVRVMDASPAYPFKFAPYSADGRLPSYSNALSQVQTMVTNQQALGEYTGDAFVENSYATHALGRLERSSEVVIKLKEGLRRNWRVHQTSSEKGEQNPLENFILASMVWHTRHRIEPDLVHEKINPRDIKVIQQIDNDDQQRRGWTYVETKDGKHGVCCLPVHCIANSSRDSNVVLLQDPQSAILIDKPPANTFKAMMDRDAVDYALDPSTPSAIVDVSSHRGGKAATVVKTVTFNNKGSSVQRERVVSYTAYNKTIAEVLNAPKGGASVQQNMIDSWRSTINPASRELGL